MQATGSASELRVRDLMTAPVFTLTAMQSLPLAESMMGLHHVRHIPVVDADGRVVGLVTHRDLLGAKISSLAPLSEDERSELQLRVPVARIMRRDVWTISPDAHAISAARIMREHRFGCLPVVERERLVGIISEADLLALVTESLSLDRPARPWTMEHVMTSVPVTIEPSTTLADARATMSRYGIRHLPVVERDVPVSMVCERGLGIAESVFRETGRTSAAHAAHMLGNGRVHRVPRDARLGDVLHDMFRERREAVVVMDGEELVGIFTMSDACRLLADALTVRE
jgi:CBS domain-containing membrane protein